MDILVLNEWFFVQVVNFLVILVLLNVVLITPIRRVLKKRADTIAAQASEIEGFTSTADAKIKNYQAVLEDARRAAGATRLGLREAGLAEEKAILEVAGVQAGDTLKAARAQVATESKAALETMLAGVAGMADKAASKILGASV
jgi:F-type H+-transporting ATPase subunit b